MGHQYIRTFRPPGPLRQQQTKVKPTNKRGILHDLILGDAAGGLGTVHGLRARTRADAGTGAHVHILDKGDAERTTAILVAGKLGDGRLCGLRIVELDHTGAAGAAIGLVLDLRAFDLADGGEQIDQIFIAGGPGQLRMLVVDCQLGQRSLTLRT